MPTGFKGVLICLALFGFAATARSEVEGLGEGLVLIEGREFEIVSNDRISGNEMRRKTETFGRFARELFRISGDFEAWPVRIEWLKGEGSMTPWQIDWGGFNQVILRLGSEFGDSDRALYEGLAAAWLMREADSIGGSEAIDNIPEWLISAVALDFIKSRYPSADGPWAGIARSEQPTLLKDLLDLSYKEVQGNWQLASQTWYLFDRLLAMALGQEEKRAVARALLAGGDPRYYITERVFDEANSVNSFAEIWWLTEWDRFIWDGIQRVRPLDMSRADLERLAFWSISLDEDEVWIDASVFLRPDIELSEPLQFQMEKRVIYIKRGFAQINPAYINALHSLGLYYEALLLNKRDEAAEIWKTFSGDIRAGREIWQAIQGAEDRS
ncbi:MAG: hypothetical protein AAF212_02575 [Verrucomicrobiota bacterium]